MPRVERNAEVTIVVLIYRSLKWLDFVMEGVDKSFNGTRYRWCVVANDATDEVRNDPRITVDWENYEPSHPYIERVYRAWNEGVLNAPTQLCVLMNSDMHPHDYWLDELMWAKQVNPRSVPTSLLVESGKILSAMPETVRDFGKHPDEFDNIEFYEYAKSIERSGNVEDGRLFMPILIDRQEFFDVGGYPEGNPPGTTGDKDLIRRYKEAGFKHTTALGSVVYHCQEGEQRWP